MNQVNLTAWIKQNCPTIWGMLNLKAKKNLPLGLAEYIGFGCFQEIDEGRKRIVSIERYLNDLIIICGQGIITDKYRRDLSGLNSENQVTELFCEIALSASLGKYSKRLELRPATGKGTYSDCLFNIGGFDIYGEAKRLADPWPYTKRIGINSNNVKPHKRSISQTFSEQIPKDSLRPRSMDLRSKLRYVYRQFPNETLNILFLFHPSIGESEIYIEQALFGNYNSSHAIINSISEKGLFSIDEWQNISAVFLCCVGLDSRVNFPLVWKNPHSKIELPDFVKNELKS